MNGYQSLFKKEVQNYLYPFLWLHGESHDVLKTYIDKIKEARMSALCIEARPHPGFVKQPWWDDVGFIIQELKKKDMKMWILDDSHFPTGYANGKIKACYPEYLKIYLNCRCYDVQGPLQKARIDLKLLKGRVWDKPEEHVHIIGVYMAKRVHQETMKGNPIEEQTIIDITNNMRLSDRLLSLDIPAGAHRIFVVFETQEGLEKETKDYLNPLVKEATQILIDEVYEPHYEHYKDEFGKTILGFFSDEPRFGNAKGTDCGIGMDMPLPWRRGLEEALPFDKKYLPLLWQQGKQKERDIRLLYMDLITRLYNENFTRVLATWCELHKVAYLGHTIEDNGAHARLGYGTGHYFRGQEDMHMAGIDVIGTQIVPGMNYHHDAFSTGGSNGEFYHYALAKLASSAAHVDAKKGGRVMCEAFGAYGWNEGLKTMKWIADSLMVRGVNYLVPHAFNPRPFPDWDCPPHFYAQGHNPQFRYFGVLSDYMNRVMSLFRDGQYPAQVGLFYPAEMEWTGSYMPVEKPARELTIHQISFDIISSDFLKKAKIEQGHYQINGNAYNVLLLPYGECIPKDLVAQLYLLIQHHIPVMFVQALPNKVAGSYDELQWKEVMRNSTIISLKTIGSTLQKFQAIHMKDQQKDLVVGEYIRDNKHIYMLFNESTVDTIHTRVQFPASGRRYQYDAFQDLLQLAEDDEVHLTPYESAIYIVTDEQIPVQNIKKRHYQSIPLPSHWDVSFADSFAYPDVSAIPGMHSLTFVHEITGYEDACGTLRYTAPLKVSEVTHMLLDLGNVYETAEVFVNEISAGIRLCKPYVFDITPYIKHGENTLSIEVTNTLGTQIRDGLSHYLPIEPFGVEGPVKLMIEKRD